MGRQNDIIRLLQRDRGEIERKRRVPIGLCSKRLDGSAQKRGKRRIGPKCSRELLGSMAVVEASRASAEGIVNVFHQRREGRPKEGMIWEELPGAVSRNLSHNTCSVECSVERKHSTVCVTNTRLNKHISLLQDFSEPSEFSRAL